MKKLTLSALAFGIAVQAFTQKTNEDVGFKDSDDLKVKKAEVVFDKQLQQLVWSIEVNGIAGTSKPKAIGQLDGAPVLGYVFPTTLSSISVGFDKTEGIVALALTSHPDFDDTPLWDENNDRVYDNDGIIWHPHWVVLTKDDRVAGGLSVKQIQKAEIAEKLPPTNPGMPMYMDSPGFPVVASKSTIRVVIPAYRMNNSVDFKYDAVTAYMQVNTSLEDKPLLGVYAVYSVLSGDLSLPYTVKQK
ncbi:MAG: hypothetical protein AAGF85_03840 [Bacteroidota bacterium]